MQTHRFTYRNNERGFTLVEVLVAVTLFSLLATGLIGVAMSGVGQTDEVQKNINLQNETQSIMTNMWTTYNTASEQKQSSVTIPITQTSNVPENFKIKNLTINGKVVSPTAKSIRNIDPSKTLTIEMITESDAEEDIVMRTTWKPVADGTRMCGLEPGTLTTTR